MRRGPYEEPPQGGFPFSEHNMGMGGGPGPQDANGMREAMPPPLLGDPQVDGQTGGPSDPKKERKFSNRARLFVGNLPRDFTEEELKTTFEKFGEVQEVFIQKEKNFGFVRMVRAHNRILISASPLFVLIGVQIRCGASHCYTEWRNDTRTGRESPLRR